MKTHTPILKRAGVSALLSLALLNLCSCFAPALHAQSVGQFTINKKVNSNGPLTPFHWTGANSVLWGTNSSGVPGNITLSADFDIVAGQLVWAGEMGVSAWGDITGTLADQADLQTALNAKASLSGASFTGNIFTTGNIGSDGEINAATHVLIGNSGHILQSGGGEFNVVIFPDKLGATAYVPLVQNAGGLIDLGSEVTGFLPVANGGTGATDASNARSNLGLTIGTHVLAPTGDGSGLTSLNASALSSGTVATARLGSGTANNTTFLRGDGTWSVPAGSGGGITDLTGDVTASGTGSVTATLANTAVTPGTYAPMAATVDSKGRITSASSIPLDFPEGLPTMAVDLIDGAMHGIRFLYNAEYPDPPSVDYQRAWVVAGPGTDQRRIVLPSVEGTLALTSDLPQSAVVDVHKNGTDQTGLGNGSWVTVTFSTEASDTGSDFSSNALMVATGERWILEVVVKTLQAHNANLVSVAVYRNGSFHKLLSAGASYASGATYGGSVILHEGGNYDIRAHSPSGQALSVSGTIGETWLKAIRVK